MDDSRLVLMEDIHERYQRYLGIDMRVIARKPALVGH